MPVLVAIIGAITTFMTYWLIWGNGLEHIDAWLNDRRNASADSRPATQRNVRH